MSFLAVIPPNFKILEDFMGNRAIRRKEYAFILYPESCSSDWLSVITGLQQPFFWILHDKDLNPDGSPKKPHYHIMIMFDNPRSENSLRKLSIRCGGNGHLSELISRRGYARYLCHLDNPEKHRYDSKLDLHEVCGADYKHEISSRTELRNCKINMIKEIINFIDDNQIHVYSDLIRYSAKFRSDWLELLITYTGQVIKDHIKSEAYCFRTRYPNRNFNRFSFE